MPAGLVLAWKGAGNDNLNVMVSADNGASFQDGHKQTYGEASDHGPALVSHNSRLFMAWKGSGNENLNVAELVASTSSGDTIVSYDLGHKIVLGDTSEERPALSSR